MLKIGEKLNSSIPRAHRAMRDWDEGQLLGWIKAQAAGGADYLDINCALLGEGELRGLERLAELIRENTDLGIMLDSPSEEILKAGPRICAGRKWILNSVTLTERLDAVPEDKNLGVVAMPVGDRMPASAEERLENALKLAETLEKRGFAPENIYIDAVVETLSTGDDNPRKSLDFLRLLKKARPDLKTVAGLSNVSFGLPGRGRLNVAYLTMAVLSGLDAAILDPTDEALNAALMAALAMAGRDEYCMDYISYCREKAKP